MFPKHYKYVKSHKHYKWLTAQKHHKWLIDGYCKMVEQRIAEGWSPYILTFGFDHIRGSKKVRLDVMKGVLDRFYPIFANRTTNNSNSPSGAAKRPICVLSPDYPVCKKDKKSKSS